MHVLALVSVVVVSAVLLYEFVSGISDCSTYTSCILTRPSTALPRPPPPLSAARSHAHLFQFPLSPSAAAVLLFPIVLWFMFRIWLRAAILGRFSRFPNGNLQHTICFSARAITTAKHGTEWETGSREQGGCSP